MSYNDRPSPIKADHSLSVLRATQRSQPDKALRDLKFLVFDGSLMGTSRELISAGVEASNITVVEHDADTSREHARSSLGVALFHGSFSKWLQEMGRRIPDVDGYYLDGMGTWTGNLNAHSLIHDLWVLLEKVRRSRRIVVIALTFSERSNYNRDKKFKKDLVDILSKASRASKQRKQSISWTTDNLIRHFLHLVFLYSGWSVRRRNWRKGDGTRYRRESDDIGDVGTPAAMLFYRFELVRVRPNRRVRWPVVGGTVPGFKGEWDLHDVIDHK